MERNASEGEGSSLRLAVLPRVTATTTHASDHVSTSLQPRPAPASRITLRLSAITTSPLTPADVRSPVYKLTPPTAGLGLVRTKISSPGFNHAQMYVWSIVLTIHALVLCLRRHVLLSPSPKDSQNFYIVRMSGLWAPFTSFGWFTACKHRDHRDTSRPQF